MRHTGPFDDGSAQAYLQPQQVPDSSIAQHLPPGQDQMQQYMYGNADECAYAAMMAQQQAWQQQQLQHQQLQQQQWQQQQYQQHYFMPQQPQWHQQPPQPQGQQYYMLQQGWQGM